MRTILAISLCTTSVPLLIAIRFLALHRIPFLTMHRSLTLTMHRIPVTPKIPSVRPWRTIPAAAIPTISTVSSGWRTEVGRVTAIRDGSDHVHCLIYATWRTSHRGRPGLPHPQRSTLVARSIERMLSIHKRNRHQSGNCEHCSVPVGRAGYGCQSCFAFP